MPRRNRNANPERYPLEVRFKNNGIFRAHHQEARTNKQAAMQVVGKGKILSVRKVHPLDIIGNIKSMNLQGIIGVMPRRTENVVFDGTTVESIVFPKLGESKRLHLKRQHLRKGKEGK